MRDISVSSHPTLSGSISKPNSTTQSINLNASSHTSAAHFLPLPFLFLLISAASATDHIVGGHFGWNPNVNYSLWSHNQTFYVNDLVSFRYVKNQQYNVFEVNKTGYDNCTMDGISGNWTSGKDFILLDTPKTYYFICGNGMCQSGMKVAVTVHRLPSNSTSPSKGSESSSESSSSGANADKGFVGLAVAVAVAGWMLLWSGSGWM